MARITVPGDSGLHAAEGGDVDEELADESVERGQSGDGRRGDEECHGGPAHRLDQAAEVVDVPRAGAVDDGARPEEQQALEHRVIEHVEDAAAEPEHRQRRLVPS